MNAFCTVQLFKDQHWQDAVIVELLGDVRQGWQTATRVDYLLDYALQELERQDAAALSWALPVSIDSHYYPTWPPFLMDLLPQGYGRIELLKHLGLPDTAEQSADWSLLMAGAANPIGHLRIKEAWELVQHQAPVHQGFSKAEIIARGEQFIESLASHGLFVSGSSGVQGEWPKLLLTEAKDGLFYLDHGLPDSEAKQHWLVKFGRGSDTQLAKILKHEAIYMRLAQFLGLRVHGCLELQDRTLFVPRFDRTVSRVGVQRHAQESLAVLCNQAGFGVRLSHNQICQVLSKACTQPEQEIIEYLKRDMANVALGNKDNHLRNTAIFRDWNGQVRLTPLFDFVPMWLHPEGIARTIRWERDDHGTPNWASVIRQVVEMTSIKEDVLKAALKQTLPCYQQLEAKMLEEQVDQEIIDNSHYRIDSICQQLAEL